MVIYELTRIEYHLNNYIISISNLFRQLMINRTSSYKTNADFYQAPATTPEFLR